MQSAYSSERLETLTLAEFISFPILKRDGVGNLTRANDDCRTDGCLKSRGHIGQCVFESKKGIR